MTQISIKKEYEDILKSFGDIQLSINSALRRYIIDMGTERVEKCETEIRRLEQKHGCSYESFLSRIGTDSDPGFLEKLSKQHPTWEADFNLWETYLEELKRWKERIRSILPI